MLKNAHPRPRKNKEGEEVGFLPREKAGLFIFDECEQWLRCVPVIPRDDKKMDDVNTDAEDHNADETRYLVRWSASMGGTGSVTGAW
jgi:hypothetical protein